MIERLLAASIPAALAIALVIASVIGIGMLVNDHLNGPQRFGALSEAAASVAAGPEDLWQVTKRRDPLSAARRLAGRYGDRAGWYFSEVSGPAPSGYLLLSRHDGDLGRAVVEFVTLADGEVQHRWLPDADVLLADASRELIGDDRNWATGRFRAIHPYAAPNGDLLVKSHNSPLMRLSPCGELIWVQEDRMFHHEAEPDPNGNLWVSTHLVPTSYGDEGDFIDDGIALVSPGGEILVDRSLVRLPR